MYCLGTAGGHQVHIISAERETVDLNKSAKKKKST